MDQTFDFLRQLSYDLKDWCHTIVLRAQSLYCYYNGGHLWASSVVSIPGIFNISVGIASSF